MTRKSFSSWMAGQRILNMNDDALLRRNKRCLRRNRLWIWTLVYKQKKCRRQGGVRVDEYFRNVENRCSKRSWFVKMHRTSFVCLPNFTLEGWKMKHTYRERYSNHQRAKEQELQRLENPWGICYCVPLNRKRNKSSECKQNWEKQGRMSREIGRKFGRQLRRGD